MNACLSILTACQTKMNVENAYALQINHGVLPRSYVLIFPLVAKVTITVEIVLLSSSAFLGVPHLTHVLQFLLIVHFHMITVEAVYAQVEVLGVVFKNVVSQSLLVVQLTTIVEIV